MIKFHQRIKTAEDSKANLSSKRKFPAYRVDVISAGVGGDGDGAGVVGSGNNVGDVTVDLTMEGSPAPIVKHHHVGCAQALQIHSN